MSYRIAKRTSIFSNRTLSEALQIVSVAAQLSFIYLIIAGLMNIKLFTLKFHVIKFQKLVQTDSCTFEGPNCDQVGD